MNTYYLVLTTCSYPIDLTFKENKYTLEKLHEIYLGIYGDTFIGIYESRQEANIFKDIDNKMYVTPTGDRLSDDFKSIVHLENCLALNIDTEI